MIRHLEYTRARLTQTSERLRALVYPETRAPDELLVSPAVDRIPWEEAQRLEYRPAELGERFGPLWATYWFRAEATVPEAWAGKRVDLLWDSHSEATLWLGGRAVQGLDRHHRDPASMLALYRSALALRPRGGSFAWRESPPGMLVFDRDDVVCLLNVDAEPLELPAGERLLASEPDVRGELPPNTAAWVRTREGGRP